MGRGAMLFFIVWLLCLARGNSLERELGDNPDIYLSVVSPFHDPFFWNRFGIICDCTVLFVMQLLGVGFVAVAKMMII